jgi:hypothetical protein
MARAARAMVMATKAAGEEDGNGKGGKSNCDSNEGGRQATKRVSARVGRAIAAALRMAGKEEGNGKGGKSDGNDKEGGGQATATMANFDSNNMGNGDGNKVVADIEGNGQGSKRNRDGHEDGGQQRGQWQGQQEQ